MQVLELFTPGLEGFVRYKVLDPKDVDAFVEECSDLTQEEYARSVLEHVVYNLRSEVLTALKGLDKDEAQFCMETIYNGCVMLNPGIDVDKWLQMSALGVDAPTEVPSIRPALSSSKKATSTKKKATTKNKKESKKTTKRLSKARYKGMAAHLKGKIIGQEEAIDALSSVLKRSLTGLSDPDRPKGVFLFAGASGVGKSQLAKELQEYLYGKDSTIVRIDCGEYQHKHENQKLLGSPNGYLRSDEGGQLTNKVAANPNCVVLLDEVEKAHPDIWDTFLKVFDDGYLTDGLGTDVSFKDTIVIMTTNLGNNKIVQSSLDNGAGFNKKINVDISTAEIPKREYVINHTNKEISKRFKPEFLNRLDKVVIFNHLDKDVMAGIASLEMEKLEDKLKTRGIILSYGDEVLEKLVELGANSIEGVRGLSKIRRDMIEDLVSDIILESTVRSLKGALITIYIDDSGNFAIECEKPERTQKKVE